MLLLNQSPSTTRANVSMDTGEEPKTTPTDKGTAKRRTIVIVAVVAAVSLAILIAVLFGVYKYKPSGDTSAPLHPTPNPPTQAVQTGRFVIVERMKTFASTSPFLFGMVITLCVVVLAALVIGAIFLALYLQPKLPEPEPEPIMVPEPPAPEPEPFYRKPWFLQTVGTYALLTLLYTGYRMLRPVPAGESRPWHSLLDMAILGCYYMWNWLLTVILHKLLYTIQPDDTVAPTLTAKVYVQAFFATLLAMLWFATCFPLWILWGFVAFVKSGLTGANHYKGAGPHRYGSISVDLFTKLNAIWEGEAVPEDDD